MNATSDPNRSRLHPEAEVRGDEVVAGAPGMDLGPGVTEAVGDEALDRGVDVLVGGVEHERPRIERCRRRGKRPLDGGPLLGYENARPFKGAGMVGRRSEVLPPHPPVELNGVAES